jgi:hypothetical protein
MVTDRGMEGGGCESERGVYKVEEKKKKIDGSGVDQHAVWALRQVGGKKG